ncbi:ABC transporter permease [Diplocloster agilis]|uniref:ABC transporter permease subunit n=1 Tax=Diplocloster agilis TaxID=2850323 RepID=A0A949JX32_9FIRM|nr:MULTISPECIES: ABC transporter permease subunit [Lachnospiraceae]MBU9735686.1 ABC transporter permease subunit [Diplocloster agilis]MBU9742963.1 ABC transporter permease subunit [Diplocloster agilis]MCU6732424.1 ABC transporter permease subunit [Suonthocola fibrivorans]SCI46604.1 Inner membrane ABC transporter permease protein ycjO [uncultured Clostridium sp.]
MINKTKTLPLKRVKEPFKKNFKRNYQLYILLLLPVAWLLLFKYGPMYGLLIAFKDYEISKGILGSDWVGFANFDKFFHNYMFGKVIRNTLTVSFYQLIASFPFPIILALALNSTRKKKFGKTVQTLTYMPYFISVVVLCSIVIQFLSPRMGIINEMIRFFGGTPKDFMADPNMFPHIYVWSGIWQSCGWGTIVYLAALSGVDESLHEAAMIDGATRFQRVRYIDFRCILPTASIMLILNAGQIMNIGFEKAFLLQNQLNKDTSEIISTFTYNVGFATAVTDFSMATAIGLFNSVINLILILTVNKISKKLSDTSLF